jgi:microcystin-dependent protein
MAKNLEEIRGFKNAAIGTIMAWSGGSSDLPTGWLACDGAAVNNTDYPLLQEVIGYTYGGSDASATFQVPNLNTGKVPFGEGSTYSSESNNNTGSVVLNADWAINGKPNKVIQYSNASVAAKSGTHFHSKKYHFQSRMMSLENLPGHGHDPGIVALNSQHTGNPSAEAVGEGNPTTVNMNNARSIINRTGLSKIGGPNDAENNRMVKPPQAHGHEAMDVQIQPGSLAINGYDDNYNSDNMSVTNYPGVGNASLDFTQPYQTAVYMIKAY